MTDILGLDDLSDTLPATEYARKGRIFSIRLKPDEEGVLTKRMHTELYDHGADGLRLRREAAAREGRKAYSLGAFVVRMALKGSADLEPKAAAAVDPRQTTIAAVKKASARKRPKKAAKKPRGRKK